MDALKKSQIRESIATGILKNVPYVLRTNDDRQKLDGCSADVMAVLDCQGKGPGGRITIGRKRAYLTDAYLDWLMDRIKN